MRISNQSINQTKQQNFTSINLIQVSKKRFENDLHFLEKIIRNNKTMLKENPKQKKIDIILSLLGLKPSSKKSFSFVEQPFYLDILDDFNQLKQAEIIRANSRFTDYCEQVGIQITENNPDYYSVYICTKRQKDKVFSLLTGINMLKCVKKALNYSQELHKKNKLDLYQLSFIQKLKMNEILMSGFNKIMAKDQKDIRILGKAENILEIPQFLEQIDY